MASYFGTQTRAGGGLRKRIAVVVDAFDVKYQSSLVRHLRLAAEQRRTQLVVFPGGILGSAERGARQRNLIYDLINSASVDGVILLSSTLSSVVGSSGIAQFCRQFRDLPLCSIGDRIEGVPSVLVNNERGVRDIVRHLIVDHGHRRFAFIRGTPGNIEAEARYRAFCDELAAHGIESDLSLAPAGDFLLDSGRKAMNLLLDRPALSLDAVVACNDYMALGALEVITQRKASLGRPVGVVGFDNIDEANVSAPPLSTIEQPLSQMAETAIRCVLTQLQGEVPPSEYQLDTWLVIRRSCGCASSGAREAANCLGKLAPVTGSLEVKFARRKDCITAELSRAARGYFHGVKNWENSLLSALIDDLRGVPGNAFSAAVENLLQGISSGEGELWRFHDVISVLRMQVLTVLGESAAERAHAEDLFQLARVLAGEAVVRVQAHVRLWLERTSRALNQLGTELNDCIDIAALRRRLNEELPKLGVRQLHIGLSAPSGHEAQARLLSSFYDLDEPDPAKPTKNEFYPAVQLLPEKPWLRARETSWVVLPLYFGQESLGFVLVDLGRADGTFFESLRLQLSAPLWRVLRRIVDVHSSVMPATVRHVAS
jgi:DNA-binding LacI/PurR family transcriptional regulator